MFYHLNIFINIYFFKYWTHYDIVKQDGEVSAVKLLRRNLSY